MTTIAITGVPGLPEVRPGDDIADLVARAVPDLTDGLADGDILVVTSKIVSKAEGRIRRTGTTQSRTAQATAVPPPSKRRRPGWSPVAATP